MKKQEFLPPPPPHYNALNASVLGEKISARKGYVHVR